MIPHLRARQTTVANAKTAISVGSNAPGQFEFALCFARHGEMVVSRYTSGVNSYARDAALGELGRR